MIADFFSGLSFFRKGWKFLFAHKNLYKFLVIPMIINLALFVGLGFLIYHYYTPLLTQINDHIGTMTILGGGWASSVIGGVLWFFSGLLKVVLSIALLALMVFTFYVLSQIINSPFYDLLSEATEKNAATNHEEIPFSWSRLWRETKNAVYVETQKMGFFLVVPFILLLLNLIPLAGSFFYTIIVNIFAAFAFGFNYLSYPLTRRQWAFWPQIRMASQHKMRLAGLGLPLMIPFFNLLFAPIFVVGGTLLYLELEQESVDPDNLI